MSGSGNVLIVDDKETMLDLLVRVLGERFDVSRAKDGLEALAKLEVGAFDVVLSDIKMPNFDGQRLLEAIKASQIDVEVVLMTAHASIQSAVEAMRAGAFDYLEKPFEPDEAVLRVARAVEHKRLRERAQSLAKYVGERYDFSALVGSSAALERAFVLMRKASTLDLTVLITGESGTGKELAARAIHHASERKLRPFVAVNCGAFPPELIESELFGHAKGSFSGAVADRRGLIEEAADGTLFLDEIGDLPLQLQVKFNRALQEREFRRVGETKDRSVGARIIAATNVDLKARVATGKFREDLFYRLHVFPIALPPLRNRCEDVPVLAAHFLAKSRTRMKCQGPTQIALGALRALTNYGWPGNVRELENVISRAAAICEGDAIDTRDLPGEVAQGLGNVIPEGGLSRLGYREATELLHDRGTREYLVALLGNTGGNVSKAAEQAGLARESLHRLLRKHHVDPDGFRDNRS